jgi:hypothetical protein
MNWQTTLTILFCVSTTSVSNASIIAWHTAEAITPNAFVDLQGSENDSTYLRCDKSQGDCSWIITLQARIEDGTSRRYSVWLRDPAGNATTLSVSQTSTAGSIYQTNPNIQQNGANGRISLIEVSTNPDLGASNTLWFLHKFVLTKHGTDTSGETLVMAGSNGWTGFEPADPGDLFRRVALDGNGNFQFGFPPGEWPDPVIRITNVPEPASLGLLACGLVLLRRRRGITTARPGDYWSPARAIFFSCVNTSRVKC